MTRLRNQRGIGPVKSQIANQEGQALIEFALITVFVMLLIIGIIEMVVFIHTYNVLADSAKEGVRYAIVHGADSTAASGPTCPCSAIDGDPGTGIVKTYAQYSLHDVSGTNMTVSVTYNPAGETSCTGTTANKPPCTVQVVATYPYNWLFGLGWSSVNVSASAEGRIVF